MKISKRGKITGFKGFKGIKEVVGNCTDFNELIRTAVCFKGAQKCARRISGLLQHYSDISGSEYIVINPAYAIPLVLHTSQFDTAETLIQKIYGNIFEGMQKYGDIKATEVIPVKIDSRYEWLGGYRKDDDTMEVQYLMGLEHLSPYAPVSEYQTYLRKVGETTIEIVHGDLVQFRMEVDITPYGIRLADGPERSEIKIVCAEPKKVIIL